LEIPVTLDASSPGRSPKTVLVLQGGGALGSYQGGVFQALNEYGFCPDWVAGISIGALNAALIAGNPPHARLDRLRAFWELITSSYLPTPLFPRGGGRSFFNEASAALIAALGAPGFFKPRAAAPFLAPAASPEALSFYDTAPLRETLLRLVDFDLINSGETRISVGAVNIRSGNQVIFDNREGPWRGRIGPEHIMASAALPPGFPPIEIDGEVYWDGGIVSNTPLEFVLDAEAETDLVIFQVDLFNARGAVPKTLLEAVDREKEIRFSSRTRLNSDVNLRRRMARVALAGLLEKLPPELALEPEVALLRVAAREPAVALVQLIYRKKGYENGSKDYEFSRQTMVEHWQMGRSDVAECMALHADDLKGPLEPGVTVLDPGLEPSHAIEDETKAAAAQ